MGNRNGLMLNVRSSHFFVFLVDCWAIQGSNVEVRQSGMHKADFHMIGRSHYERLKIGERSCKAFRMLQRSRLGVVLHLVLGLIALRQDGGRRCVQRHCRRSATRRLLQM